MNESQQYLEFARPSWAPPAWLFGPVWSFLYVIIILSFGSVFYKFYQGKITWLVVLPFVLNLIFNLAFTPIQFGLRNNFLAAIDITLVLITLVWAMVAISTASLQSHLSTGSPTFYWIALVNIPYLLWVLFATALQFSVTYLNWS